MTLLEWPRRVAALGQFHLRDVANPELDSKSEHHLRHVLRAREGEEIVVTDGRGSWALCVVRNEGLEPSSEVHLDPRPIDTTLYLAPLKGDRGEWALAKATEVGISRVVPLLSSRVVVKCKGDARDKMLARWRRIARECAAQCRRTYDVVVEDPLRVDQVPEEVAVCDLSGGGDWSGLRSVAVGPEGGWDPREWSDTRRRVGLGPTVLRAETASVVASSLLTFQAGGWGFTLSATRNE
ncbi:MAG: RsmE family RNA methyltransferase [Acidimicrobiales bacterium]